MVATNELLGLGAANVAGAFCGAVPTRPGWNLKRDMVKEVVKIRDRGFRIGSRVKQTWPSGPECGAWEHLQLTTYTPSH